MKAKILGVDIDHVTMEQAVERISDFVEEPEPHLIVTANSEMVMMANEDPLLYEILNRADLVVPDGIGVVWASRLLKKPLPERVPGVELMEKLLARSAESQWRVFLLGAEPETINLASANIAKLYPGINIVGTHHGFFKHSDHDEILTTIKAARPDILFIALGVPKQEKWAAAHIAELEVPVAIGVGGSFQILAGTVKRAPAWMRSHGLEWLYRLITQPHRIGRMLALPRFALRVLVEKFSSGRDLTHE